MAMTKDEALASAPEGARTTGESNGVAGIRRAYWKSFLNANSPIIK